ncbi:helix-turn-helix domain-containing protein [Streptomyces hygroscopicus]|uniref:helix-turn-helix domain-containing protein n=1 Tax=Streptomyces hygroscopicus TaxID=1912 RepID=UPI00363F5F66
MGFKTRESRKEQGRKKLHAEREEYFRLVQQGFSNARASRRVGVNPRTGREGRNGRPEGGKKRPRPLDPRGRPRRRPDTSLNPSASTSPTGWVRRPPSGQIAAELGRSPSTISREIRRNLTVDPRGQRHYRPYAAQSRADARRPRPKPGKIGQCTRLRDYIQERLERRWSQSPDSP